MRRQYNNGIVMLHWLRPLSEGCSRLCIYWSLTKVSLVHSYVAHMFMLGAIAMNAH